MQADNRLEGLMESKEANPGAGEMEMLRQTVSQRPWAGFLAVLIKSGLVALSTVAVCYTFRLDPVGGLRWDSEGAWHAGLGALAALPSCLFFAFSWAPLAAERLPVMGEWQSARLKTEDRCVIEHLPFLQAVVGGAATSAADAAFVLLALQQGLQAALTWWLGNAEQLGMPVPALLPLVLSTAACAVITAVSQILSLYPDLDEQMELLRVAQEKAPHFYRTTVPQGPGRAGEHQLHTLAFKAVTRYWLLMRAGALTLQLGFYGFHCVLLCALWHATGDLAAPLGAEGALSAVNYVSVAGLLMARAQEAEDRVRA